MGVLAYAILVIQGPIRTLSERLRPTKPNKAKLPTTLRQAPLPFWLRLLFALQSTALAKMDEPLNLLALGAPLRLTLICLL